MIARQTARKTAGPRAAASISSDEDQQEQGIDRGTAQLGPRLNRAGSSSGTAIATASVAAIGQRLSAAGGCPISWLPGDWTAQMGRSPAPLNATAPRASSPAGVEAPEAGR